jgi:hypothetical protein
MSERRGRGVGGERGEGNCLGSVDRLLVIPTPSDGVIIIS